MSGGHPKSTSSTERYLSCGSVTLDTVQRTVTYRERFCDLTRDQSMILAKLITRSNQTVTYDEIIRHVYDGRDEPEYALTGIRAQIRQIRRKLATIELRDFVCNARGTGYYVVGHKSVVLVLTPEQEAVARRALNAAGMSPKK